MLRLFRLRISLKEPSFLGLRNMGDIKCPFPCPVAIMTPLPRSFSTSVLMAVTCTVLIKIQYVGPEP